MISCCAGSGGSFSQGVDCEGLAACTSSMCSAVIHNADASKGNLLFQAGTSSDVHQCVMLCLDAR